MKDSKATSTSGNLGADGLDDDFDLVETGRESIYTQVGEWVAYAPISDRAARIYWILRAHVNATRTLPNGRPDPRAFPSQKRLAAILGVRRTETIAAAVKELVDIGAVDVRQKEYANRLRRRNVYIVHMNPPDGYTGPRSNQDFTLPDDEDSAPPGAVDEPVEAPAPDQQEPVNPQVAPDPPENRVRTPLKSGWNKTNYNQRDPSSLTARLHSGERRRASPGKPENERATRRADYPANGAWIDDDPDQTVANILDHASRLYELPAGLDPLLNSKVTPPLDEDFNELPFDLPTPQHLMNIALKACRWGSVDFTDINRRIAAGETAPNLPRSSPPRRLVTAEATGINASFIDDPWGDH